MKPWCALAAFLQLQPGQAHLPGIPLRTTARSLIRFASIHKRSLCLRWSQCGTAYRNLGYLWGCCPIFQTPKPRQFPVFRGRGALSTKCLLVAIQNQLSLPGIVSLHQAFLTSWNLSSSIPQKWESTSGKPSVENYCQGLFETEELSLCHDQCKTQLHSSHPVL